MKEQQKNGLFVRVMCWILAGMMVLSVATLAIYALLGLL